MTKEEAIAYFTKCNEDIISVCKDENVYNYEKQEIEAVYLRRTFEANCMAISALKGGWIPITTRPMTEEEITSYDYYNYFFFIDEPRIMDCELPADGEEVEVTIYGKVVVDTFYNDGNEGCYFDSVNIEDVTAWRRCEPYKGEDYEEEQSKNAEDHKAEA